MTQRQEIDHRGERLDLRLRRGMSFRLLISAEDAEGNPVDLTGCTLAAAIKRTPADAAPLAEFTAGPGAAAHEATLDLSAADAGLLPVPNNLNNPEGLPWDAYIEWPDGRKEPLYFGVVYVYPEVTP
jgi:hypothetical protein